MYKERNATYVCVLLLIFHSTVCQRNREGAPQASQAYAVEKRPTQLRMADVSMNFIEDLSIKGSWIWPTKLLVDSEQRIYVFDDEDKFPTIYKYDREGKLISKTTFQRGQGPGDFAFMDPAFSASGQIYVFDKAIRRLTVLDNMLIVKKTTEFRESLYDMKSDAKGFVYGFFYGKQTSDQASPIILGRFTDTGRLVAEIFEYEATLVTKLSETTLRENFYVPYGIYKINDDGRIYCAVSNKSEIRVLDSKLRILRTIAINAKRIELNEGDIQRTKLRIYGPEYPAGQKMFYKIEFGSTLKFKPFIEDFFVLDNGFLLVLNYEYDDINHDDILADIYDESGRLVTKVTVPGYFNRYASKTAYMKTRTLRGDYFYTIEGEYGIGDFSVKRYRISWQNKQSAN